jgi:hypothetical protein
MGRAGRQSAVLGTLASEARVRGPPGHQVPVGAIRRRPRGGLPLPRSGVGAARAGRARAPAGPASASGPKRRSTARYQNSFSKVDPKTKVVQNLILYNIALGHILKFQIDFELEI